MIASEAIATIGKELENQKVVFFFGAGASYSSNLPLGNMAVQWILEALSADLENHEHLVSKYQTREKTPRFEKMISLSKEIVGDNALHLLDIFDQAIPSLPHLFVAKAALSGYLRYHLTTNFDICIDTAMKSLEVPFIEFCDPEQYDDWSPTERDFHLLSLHGATLARMNTSKGIIATLDAILEPLHGAKHDLLKQLVQSHEIVFVGYSAIDTDIYPELLKLRDSGSFWWVSPDPISDRISNLLEGDETHYLQHSADDFFRILYENLFGRVPEPNPPKSRSEFKEQLAGVIRSWNKSEQIKILVELFMFIGRSTIALDLVRELRNCEMEYSLIREADIHYQSGDWASLKQHVKELVQTNQLENPHNYAALGRICHLAELPDEAVQFAEEGYHRAKSIPDTYSKIETAFTLGNVLLFRGSHERAQIYLSEAEELAAQSPEILGTIQMSLAVLHNRCGRFEEAEKLYLKALFVFQETTDYHGQAKCHLNLVDLYRHRKDTVEKALFYIAEAKTLAVENDFNDVLSNLFANEILTLIMKEDYARALEIGDEAIEFFKNDPDPGETYANTLLDIGRVHYLKRELEPASKYYQEALAIYVQKHQAFRAALAESNLAQIAVDRRQLEDALRHLDNGYSFAGKCGDEGSRLEVTGWLLSVHTEYSIINDNPHDAKNYLSKLHYISQEIKDDDLIEEVERLERLLQKDEHEN